jgi:hypothetical protein
VDEEASQELIRGNGHDLLLAAVGIVSPAERDAIVFEGHEAMVGDGDAMGVAGQVVENMVGTAERRLGIDDPVLVAEFPEKVAEDLRQGELLKRSMKLQPVVLDSSRSWSQNFSRKILLSALTGRKNRRDESIHLEPSRLKPPAGTM